MQTHQEEDRIGLLRVKFSKPKMQKTAQKRTLLFKDIGSLTQFSVCHEITRTHSRLLFCPCVLRSEEIREVVGRMRRYRGNVVVQEQAAKMLRSLAEMRQSI